MIEAIRDDRPPYVSGEQGKMALDLVLAIYKSAKQKRLIKMPLKDFSTIEMKD